ncbi:tRNA (adenosine(37)-N6)-threonylcarbamoyltransferase complex ATPase subunit type 1 TsaE [Sediminivirga luteola]|uniref:tRNA (adenosine(37)-N6)-threonylcarbamoyltransferase complex ATPase subunit type 1 TsaE n=1 Tax=Sediminivirga luteola TaxID=1774748 RepID=UPI0035715CEB
MNAGGERAAAAADDPLRVEIADAAAMRSCALRLAGLLRAGDLLILTGGLGAGKTTFTQGLAEGLGVRGRVTSPTFIVAREHRPRADGPGLVHVDAYRLSGPEELDDLDLDSQLSGAVVVVEWGEGKAEQLAASRLEVVIDREALREAEEPVRQEDRRSADAAGSGDPCVRGTGVRPAGGIALEKDGTDRADAAEPEAAPGEHGLTDVLDEPRLLTVRAVGDAWAARREALAAALAGFSPHT